MNQGQSKLPVPMRVLNLAGRAAVNIGWHPVDLRGDTLLAAAVGKTGLSDYGDAEFRQPFQLLLDGLEREANLTLLGRVAARADILRLLENRLRLVDLCKQHPEIEQQNLQRPLFVVGPPRTGTTIFHDLLALDPDNRVPMSWETAYPTPPPEAASYLSDARIARVEAELAQVDKLIPEFKKMHPMGAQRPQECVSITSHDFSSLVFNTQYRVPSYESWVMAAEMRSALRFHRRFLQVLQWKAPGKRWALKSPQHIWHIEHLMREYPDALIVQTHRDPVRILVSISSLVATLRRLCSDTVDLPEIARDYAHGLALGYDKTIAYRKSGRLPAEQVVDIYFQDFINDQVATVRHAYAHFGLELPAAAAAAMQEFLEANPVDKHGRHLYSFDDIGMSQVQARTLFAPYQEYFSVPVEPIPEGV